MKDILKAMLDAIYGDGIIQDCITAISFKADIFTGTINSIGTVVKPVAGVLVCIYFMIELMNKLTNDNFSSEQFIKMLIKLVFSIIMIENIPQWSIYLMNFSTVFTDAIKGSIPGIASIDASAIIDKFSFLETLGALALMLLPYAASFVVKIAVTFIGYGRAIEIGLRSAFAPIGCADLVTGGTNSSGFRYIRRMLGIALQGGVMIAVVICSSTVITQVAMGGEIKPFDLIFIGKYFGCLGSMIGLLASSKQLAFELVGA